MTKVVSVVRSAPGVVLAAMLLLSAKANASSLLYQFDTPFPSDPSPAGSGPWIDASFQDVSGGVLLTITNVSLISGEFIQGNGSGANGGFFFNLNPNDNPNNLVFTSVYANGNFGTSILTGENAYKADGDGKYDIVFDFSTHNFSVGSSISYLISGIPGLNADSFAYLSAPAGGSGPFYAAVHVMGLPPNASNSTWVEPGGGPQVVPVPEPAPAVLAAVSFGLWGALLRWRKRKA